MRKSKLIELLQAMPGDPEVLIWNGLVEDWMKVAGVSQERLISYKNGHSEWMVNDWMPEEKVKVMCKTKKVLMIDPLPRKKNSFGRGGSLGY